METLELARWQFAATTVYHFLFVPLTLGLSVLVAGLVIRSAWGLVSDSIRVLLQATPKGIRADEIEAGLRSLPDVSEAGHFHAWTLTDESIVATVHVSPAEGVDPLSLPPVVSAWLKAKGGIDHVIGRRDHLRQGADVLGVVAEAAKRGDRGHDDPCGTGADVSNPG